MKTYETKPLNAVLVGIQTPGVTEQDLQASLDELGRLVTTLGYNVIGRMSQKRQSERKALVLGDGKLKDLAKWTGGTGIVGPAVEKKKHKAALRQEKEKQRLEEERLEAESIDDDSVENLDLTEEVENLESTNDQAPTELAQITIFDCELSPSQLRNLEKATGAPVLDRTGVIIEIFSRHAKTRAARLQVEIARLSYVAPRLRETAGDEDRGGGGTGAKGAGETSLELDRRAIRDRIKELKDEFVSIAQEHDVRRARRTQELTVALVGYTNAGKSSLMRALTGSDVLVADRLFATLDTTVRLMQPETRPRILISDTVGFIKKLPHDLVASFKSTLDEALNASLLLYVVDSSDPTFRSQLDVTRSVLAEVGAGDVPHRLVLNKVDRLTQFERSTLQREFPEAFFLSALQASDVASLRERLIEHFDREMVDEGLLIPYSSKGVLGEIRESVRVLGESYDEAGVRLDVRGPKAQIDRLKAKLKRQADEW